MSRAVRCPDCRRLASLEPGDVDIQDETLNEAEVSVDVRIVLNCAQCSTELKEAHFSIQREMEQDFFEKHSGEGHELNLTIEPGRLKNSSRPKPLMESLSGTLAIKRSITVVLWKL